MAKETMPSVIRRVPTRTALPAGFCAAILATDSTSKEKWPQTTGATILFQRKLLFVLLRVAWLSLDNTAVDEKTDPRSDTSHHYAHARRHQHFLCFFFFYFIPTH